MVEVVPAHGKDVCLKDVFGERRLVLRQIYVDILTSPKVLLLYELSIDIRRP